MKSFLMTQINAAWIAFCGGWQLLRREGPGQVQFWFIALVIGIASGFAALFFRKGIEGLQSFLYGTDNVQTLHSFAQSIPWYWILMIPALGGAIGRPNLA
jgi:CIC family chloride channel protein